MECLYTLKQKYPEFEQHEKDRWWFNQYEFFSHLEEKLDSADDVLSRYLDNTYSGEYYGMDEKNGEKTYFIENEILDLKTKLIEKYRELLMLSIENADKAGHYSDERYDD